MKLSIFVPITKPVERQDPYKESITNFSRLADEVVVVCGDESDLEIIETNDKVKTVFKKWDKDDYKAYGNAYMAGFQACTGDWAIRADIDYFFKETDFEMIRKTLEVNSNQIAYSFLKYNFLLADRYNLKCRLPLAANMKYKDSFSFDCGGDLAQMGYNGEKIIEEQLMPTRLPVYNYDNVFKTKDVITKLFYNQALARYKKLGDNWGWESPEKAFEYWINMQVGRITTKAQQKIKIEEHPEDVQELVRNITPEQFGYDMFGNSEEAAYK